MSLGSATTASSASGLTLGQLAPMPAPACEVAPYDMLQPTVTSGNAYVVPSTGGITAWTVTAWSTNASIAPAAQSMALKAFRKVADPGTYMAVGHEATHNLVLGLNTFGANLKVKAGDVLGANITGGGACVFNAPGDHALFLFGGNLADGASATFDTSDDDRVNLRAEVTPTSDFAIGKVKAQPNGTAMVTLTLPNPGELSVGGKGVKGSVSAVRAKRVKAGKVKVVIGAKGKNAQKLSESGKVTVKPKITFTPTGGSPHTEKKKVKLRRK